MWGWTWGGSRPCWLTVVREMDIAQMPLRSSNPFLILEVVRWWQGGGRKEGQSFKEYTLKSEHNISTGFFFFFFFNLERNSKKLLFLFLCQE